LRIGARRLVDELGERQHSAQQQAKHGNGKERLGAGHVRHQATANRHGDGSGDKGPRSNHQRSAPCRQTQRGEIEEQIDRPQPETGDVRQAIQAPFQTGVAAKPVVSLEKQPERQARDKSEQNAEPGGDEIQVRRLYGSLWSRFIRPAIAQPAAGALIDKTWFAIDWSDDGDSDGHQRAAMSGG